MLLNIDKFFIAELKNQGFDIDYKAFIELYRQSRLQPGCKARQKQKEKEEIDMQKLEKQFEMIRNVEKLRSVKA
jgi:hypothetical protein